MKMSKNTQNMSLTSNYLLLPTDFLLGATIGIHGLSVMDFNGCKLLSTNNEINTSKNACKLPIITH